VRRGCRRPHRGRYVSVGSEPGTAALIDVLRERGVTVLLPVLRSDDDLDWAAFDGTLAAGPRGLRQPTATGLGMDAIAGVRRRSFSRPWQLTGLGIGSAAAAAPTTALSPRRCRRFHDRPAL